MRLSLGLLLLIIIPVAPAFAQGPRVEVNFESRVLEPGEVAELQLVCSDTGMPAAPEVEVPDGLSVTLANPTPAVFSQMTIVNRQRAQTTTYTFTLRVTAQKEGRYTLGPFSVAADGSTYQSRPVLIVVKSGSDASVPRGDAFVFAEIEVSPTTVYVSQAIQASLTIGIRKVEINGRIQDNLELLRIIDGTASQLSVFPRRGWTNSETTLIDSSGRRHRYDVFRVVAPMRAEEVGETVIGPVFIKANYPTAVRQGFFGPEISRTRRETARAEGVTVTVKGAPLDGRPADFTGAIGQYVMQVSAAPARVELGQPVTLTISIKGSPLEGIAGPDLAAQSDLAGRFDFTREEMTGEVEGRAKVFRRAIFPLQVGEQSVPRIHWSYFDPTKEAYVTLSTEPIPVIVEPSTGTSVDVPEAVSGARELELKTLGGGIAPNYVDPDQVLEDHSLHVTPGAVAVLGIAPLAWLGLLVTERHRVRVRGDRGLARRRQALRHAERRIRDAVRARNGSEHMQALAQAFTEYVSDRFNVPSGVLTTAEVRSILERHAGEDLAGEVGTFLDRCDAARYAPLGHAESAQEAAEDVRGWIHQLERSR